MNPEQPNNNQQFPQNTPPAPLGSPDQAPQGQDQFTPASPTPPQNKKTGLMVAVIVIVLIIIGVVAFAMMGSDKKDGNKSTNNSTSNGSSNDGAKIPDNMQKYDVTDKTSGRTFSVSFFKGAQVEEQNGRTYLTAGETGSMQTIFLGTVEGDKIDCGETPSTAMKLGSETSNVCYRSDNTQYAGYVKTSDGLVKVSLAGQKAISMDDAKAILESVSFK